MTLYATTQSVHWITGAGGRQAGLGLHPKPLIQTLITNWPGNFQCYIFSFAENTRGQGEESEGSHCMEEVNNSQAVTRPSRPGHLQGFREERKPSQKGERRGVRIKTISSGKERRRECELSMVD